MVTYTPDNDNAEVQIRLLGGILAGHTKGAHIVESTGGVSVTNGPIYQLLKIITPTFRS